MLEIFEIPKVNTDLSEKQGLIKDEIDFAESFEIVLVDLLRVRIFKTMTIIPSSAQQREQ